MKKLLKDITIGVIFSLFVIESIFTFKIPFIKANSQRTEINYSDKDYITLNITEKDKKLPEWKETEPFKEKSILQKLKDIPENISESVSNFFEEKKEQVENVGGKTTLILK